MGLWAVAAVRIVLNVFYALQDTRTPVLIAIVALVANAGLGGLLMHPMGHNGLALALSLASMIYLMLLTWALHKRLGAFNWRLLTVSVQKSLICTVSMGAVLWILTRWMDAPQQLYPRAVGLIQLIGCVTAGAAVYALLAYALKLPEFQAVLQLLVKRKNRR
jgi:putative peptidoglycan lipid II flippase